MEKNSRSDQKPAIADPGSSSLFGKIMLPVIALMLVLMLVTGLVVKNGIRATSRRVLQTEMQSESQKVIQSLSAREQTILSASGILANDTDLKQALGESNPASLSVLNGLAEAGSQRFELDLVQIYDASGAERTDLVQSNLSKVSPVIDLLPRPGADLVTMNSRLVYLSRDNITGGGIIIVGMDLLSEIQRITFQLGMRDSISLEQNNPMGEQASVIGSNFVLKTLFLFGTHTITLVNYRNIVPINEIADSGRNIILLPIIISTLCLIAMMALFLNWMIQPVHQLARSAQEIAQADFENSGPQTLSFEDLEKPQWVGKNDEVAMLADSFAHISNEITSFNRDLVHELRQANQDLSAVRFCVTRLVKLPGITRPGYRKAYHPCDGKPGEHGTLYGDP